MLVSTVVNLGFLPMLYVAMGRARARVSATNRRWRNRTANPSTKGRAHPEPV